MSNHEKNVLTLHWDGPDKELKEEHRIDATSLVLAVEGVQTLLYLVAMDIEGHDPRERVRIAQLYRNRCSLNFEAAFPGSYRLKGVVGSADDVTGDGFVPSVMDGLFEFLQLLDENNAADELPKAFSRTVRNPVIRNRMTNICSTFIPKTGSGRTFGLSWGAGAGRKVIISERSRQRLFAMSRPLERDAEEIQSIITGRLQEMDFEKRSFKLFYPPNKSVINCRYDDADEPTLVENRREFVQVKGIAVFELGVPVQIDSVESVIDLDLSDIEVTRVPLSDGGEVVLKSRLVITPALSDDGQQMLEAVDAESGINTFGQTREELLQAITDDVEAIWENFANPRCPLTAEASRIGKWWRDHADFQAGGEA